MVKSNLASSSYSPEATKPSNQEVALRVASCNLKLDLDLNKYDPTLHIMLEFLKGHPIQKPLTKSTEFPLSIIHTAYSTSVYNSKEEYIEFNVHEDKTTKLSKNDFLKAIGLPQNKKEEKTFYEPTNDEIFDVLDQMGHLPPRLEKHTDFRKGKLPATWQFLVHIMLRCLSGKVKGTDTMNKPFLVLLFGMYTGKEVDMGTTLWKDFASYVFPKKKDIPCARFWALALQKGYAKKGYTKLKSPLPEGEEMFNTRIISRFNITDQSEFGKVSRLPEAMLQHINKNSKVLIKYREDTINLPESLQPIRSIGETSSPKCNKQAALKEKKTNGVGTKRKCETTPSPQGKRKLTQTKLPFQKVTDIENRPKVTVVSQSLDHTTRPEDEAKKEEARKELEREEQQKREEEEMVRTAVKLLEQAMSAGPFTKTPDSMKEDSVHATNENRQELRMKGTSESREVELKRKEERKRLVRMLWEEKQKREDEEMVRTAAQLLERAMSDTGEVSAQAMEEDFVFTADEGLIRDNSESPHSVKPSRCRVFVGTSETESEHIEEVPNNLPTSTPFRRAKGKKQKKKPTYVSRVEFDSLNQKLLEVLDVVKKIPPSEEKFVTKDDFGEMQKVVTSLAQSVLNLETSDTNLREIVLNSTADALRDMEHKRTADTFKYMDRMDEMVKMVKEIQQSYDDLTKTMCQQHKDEIVRVSEQLCDYRNKNIILQAVLVKVIQSTHQCNLRFDEVVSLIRKVVNSMDALPKTLSNDDLSEQAQQSFSKVFELLHDLKGMKFVDEAGPSFTKGGQDENIDEVPEPQPPPPPPIITSPPTEGEIHEPPPPPPKIPTPSTSFLMPLFKIESPIKDKGKIPLEVSEVSAMKTSTVFENEKQKEDVQETVNNAEQRAPTPWVDAIRRLRDDELVPKQTTSPPSSDEFQWDIPMSPNARYYSVFQPLRTHLSREIQVPIKMYRLEKFFKVHAQPPKNVWSLRRIIGVMGYKKIYFQNKEYFHFEVIRSDNKEYSFSEADFPNLNPNDLYVICRHFQNKKILTHEPSPSPSRSPFIQIQKFLRCLVYDLGSVDAESFDGFVDDPPEEIDQELDGIGNRHRGPTEDPELGIIYSNEKDSPRLFFRLRQKHLCRTEFLKEMIDLTERSRKASEGLKVKIVEELEWWIAVRKWIKRVTDLVTDKI